MWSTRRKSYPYPIEQEVGNGTTQKELHQFRGNGGQHPMTEEKGVHSNTCFNSNKTITPNQTVFICGSETRRGVENIHTQHSEVGGNTGVDSLDP